MAAQIKTASELGLALRQASDIPEVIGALYGADGLILTEADFSEEFLNLKTGLLGELFQKLVTYRLPTAVIVPDFGAHGARFSELAHEHARHPQVRFFKTEEEARKWLEHLAG